MDIKLHIIDYNVMIVDELPKIGKEDKIYVLSNNRSKGYIWNSDKKKYIRTENVIRMDIKHFSVTTVDELPKIGEENKVYLLSSKSNESVIISDGYIWNSDKKEYEKFNIEEL